MNCIKSTNKFLYIKNFYYIYSMKIALSKIGATLFITVVFYMFGSAVGWSFYPSDWSWILRFILLISYTISLFKVI